MIAPVPVKLPWIYVGKYITKIQLDAWYNKNKKKYNKFKYTYLNKMILHDK